MEEGQQYTDLWKRDSSTLTYGRETTVHNVWKRDNNTLTYGRETKVHWLMEEGQQYTDSWKSDNTDLWKIRGTTVHWLMEGKTDTDRCWIKMETVYTSAWFRLTYLTPLHRPLSGGFHSSSPRRRGPGGLWWHGADAGVVWGVLGTWVSNLIPTSLHRLEPSHHQQSQCGNTS